jgi:hypothetical protein
MLPFTITHVIPFGQQQLKVLYGITALIVEKTIQKTEDKLDIRGCLIIYSILGRYFATDKKT